MIRSEILYIKWDNGTLHSFFLGVASPPPHPPTREIVETSKII